MHDLLELLLYLGIELVVEMSSKFVLTLSRIDHLVEGLQSLSQV